MENEITRLGNEENPQGINKIEKPGISIWKGLLIFLMTFLYVIVPSLAFMETERIFGGKLGQGSLYQFLTAIATFFAYAWLLKILKKTDKFELKLNLGLGLKGYFAVMVLLAGYIAFYGATLEGLVDKVFSNSWFYETMKDVMMSPVSAFLLVVIIAPIFEEIFLRGIILEQLSRRYNKWVMLIFVSAMFGIMHFNFIQGINAFFIGIVLGLTYYLTNSLLPCIFLHFCNNGLSFVLGFVNIPVIKLSDWAYLIGGAVFLIAGGLYLVLGKKPDQSEDDHVAKKLKAIIERTLSFKLFGNEEVFSFRFIWLIFIASMITYCAKAYIGPIMGSFHGVVGGVVLLIVFTVVAGFDHFRESRQWSAWVTYNVIDLIVIWIGIFLLFSHMLKLTGDANPVYFEGVVFIVMSITSFVRRNNRRRKLAKELEAAEVVYTEIES